MTSHGQKETFMLTINLTQNSNTFDSAEAVRNSTDADVFIEFEHGTIRITREAAMVILDNLPFMLMHAYASGVNGDDSPMYLKKNA